MKKYEFTDETIHKPNGPRRMVLHRIRALVDIPFRGIKAGQLGGFIEKEDNLSHDGNAWVGGNAIVCDNAVVKDNALVTDNAKLTNNCKVYGNAEIMDRAELSHRCDVSGSAKIYGYSVLQGAAKVYGNALVYGNAAISGNSEIFGNARIFGSAHTQYDCKVDGNNSIVWIDNLGPNWETMTFYACADGTMKMSYMWFSGTLDEFIVWVNNNKTYATYNANNDNVLFDAIILARKKLKL